MSPEKEKKVRLGLLLAFAVVFALLAVLHFHEVINEGLIQERETIGEEIKERGGRFAFVLILSILIGAGVGWIGGEKAGFIAGAIAFGIFGLSVILLSLFWLILTFFRFLERFYLVSGGVGGFIGGLIGYSLVLESVKVWGRILKFFLVDLSLYLNKQERERRRELAKLRSKPKLTNKVFYSLLFAGALFGILLIRAPVFAKINVITFGVFFGGVYGLIWEKKAKAVVIGAVAGGFCAVHPILLLSFIFGVPWVFLLIRHKDLYWLSSMILPSLFLMMMIGLELTGNEVLWGRVLLFTAFLAIPYLNIGGAFFLGVMMGSGLAEFHPYWLEMPFFALPVGIGSYLIASALKEPKKEGKKMDNIQPIEFPEPEREESIKFFSEEEVIRDLLSSLNEPGAISRKIKFWKERARTQDQIEALELIRRVIEERTEIFKSYLSQQQAILEIRKFKEFKELIMEIDRMKLELERRRIEKEIERLELEESVKRRKLELELAKIKAQLPEKRGAEELLEQIRKDLEAKRIVEELKVANLFKRAVTIALKKQELEEKYPPEVVKEILDLVDRMMKEES